MVLNTDRLLSVRGQLKGSRTDQASFSLKTITHLGVHAVPPQGVRIRFTAGLNAEDFTVTGRGAEFAQALRAVTM